MKESYDSMKQVLEKLKYSEHNWKICGDLKIVCMLLGQQGGYTKYLCFLCLWGSRAKKDHWVKQYWSKRTEFVVGEYEPLVKPETVLLPPLHIKPGLMKQFVKALDKEGDCFKYLCVKFPAITEEKLRAVYSMDLRYDDCWMIQPSSVQCNHQNWMHGMHLQRWWSIFLAIPKLAITESWWANCFKLFRYLGPIWVWKYTSCIAMWIIFLTILVQWARSKENGSIRTSKRWKRYHLYWSDSMIADYCWCMIRECRDTTYSWRAKKKENSCLRYVPSFRFVKLLALFCFISWTYISNG